MNIARRLFALGVTAGSALHLATAQTPPFSAIVDPSMDTTRIQYVIDNTVSNGAVYFKPGLYKLNGPIHLRGGRTYIGAGGPDAHSGSVLMQMATNSPKSDPGLPIFSVEGQIYQVRIIGLTFDGLPGVNARGIAAGDSAGILLISTIRDNYFLTGLSECIDVPMEVTWIERNHFGVNSVNGGWIGNRHRHIHSIYPGVEEQTTANWVSKNLFAKARGSESVLFESGVQLHITDNQFENNGADTTLQINGMLQVVIDGNRFDGNRGDALMHFANSHHVSVLNGNNIVRSQNNYYDMQHCATVCTPVYNKFIFLVDANSDNGQLSRTLVFMGNETGRHFTHSDGTHADLTDPAIALACNVWLTIVGPFSIPDYQGTETSGCK
jgi:hypothetical protein